MRHGDTNVNVDTLGCLLKPLQLGQRWLDARGEDGVHHELFVHESLPAVPVALRHLEVPIVGDLSSNGVDFLGFPFLTMRCDAGRLHFNNLSEIIIHNIIGIEHI